MTCDSIYLGLLRSFTLITCCKIKWLQGPQPHKTVCTQILSFSKQIKKKYISHHDWKQSVKQQSLKPKLIPWPKMLCWISVPWNRTIQWTWMEYPWKKRLQTKKAHPKRMPKVSVVPLGRPWIALGSATTAQVFFTELLCIRKGGEAERHQWTTHTQLDWRELQERSLQMLWDTGVALHLNWDFKESKEKQNTHEE